MKTTAFTRRLLLAALWLSGPLGAWAAEIDYHAQIAPLLRQYCAGCHNDDDFDGDFSVERYADLKEGGSKGVMLKPGDPGGSYLVKLMTGDASEPMPPADEPQPSESEVAIFRQWIQEGAKGPGKEEDVSILSLLTVPELDPAQGDRAVTAMARSSNGDRMATARFGRVTVTDASGKVIREIDRLPGKVNAIDFAPGDPDSFLTASGITGLKGVAILWKNGEVVAEFGEGYHRDLLYDAVFSPDGKLVATAGYDARIAIWDRESGERIQSIEVHNGAVFDLAFSPDGTVLASASGDQTVKLWRVSDGLRLDTLNQPQGEQYATAFSPDGNFVFAGGADNRIRMYRFVSRARPKINPVLHARFAHEAAIVAMAISDDGKHLATASEDHSVKLWRLPELQQVRAWENQEDIPVTLAFGAGGDLLAGSMDGAVRAFPFTAGQGEAMSGPEETTKPAEVVGRIPEGGERNLIEIDETAAIQTASLPFQVKGRIESEGDADEFLFHANAGDAWVLEVNAARSKSPLDSRIEILDETGEPVERVRLQAVRDSWFTFRGKNSMQANDFRVHNWREMELNEYLYCNGEVVKLWLYPRGPDSGFTVYPGFGNRHNYFGTSGLTHALGEPCYVVEPIPAGAEPVPNGLPVYTLYYENDDDPKRRLGNDSKLTFTAPADGKYRVRIGDVRGFGGDDFSYELVARVPAPDFKVSHNRDPKKELLLAPGTGKEFVVKVERYDGFDGAIEVAVEGLPPGFSASSPIVIESGQHQAMGIIEASSEAEAPSEEAAQGVRLVARARIGGEDMEKPLGDIGILKLDTKPPQLRVEILPDGESGDPAVEEGRPMELTIRPGETITAMVKAERLGFEGRIDFGKEDSGRNLAHGLIIDNIGLNGLMIPEQRSEQRFFITAAEWVPESTRTFHVRTGADGERTSQAIVIKVRPGEPES